MHFCVIPVAKPPVENCDWECWGPLPVSISRVYKASPSHCCLDAERGLPRSGWGWNSGSATLQLCACMCAKSLQSSCPTLLPLWTAAHQAPLSMGFSRQKYWSFYALLQGIFWAQGWNLHFLCLLRWQAASLPLGSPVCPAAYPLDSWSLRFPRR